MKESICEFNDECMILLTVRVAAAARHVNSCEEQSNNVVGGGVQARSGFHQIKSKFQAAKPSLLAPLLPPETPHGNGMNNEEH